MADVPVAPPEPVGAVAATPTVVPEVAPAPAAPFAVHGTWNDRLVLESEDKRFYLQPIGILQSLATFPINPAGSPFYEGAGLTFRRAAIGFDARLLGYVRTFFLANIASGTLNLWDYFTDLDFFEGRAVLRVGRFRPWQARQRLLAGDRYQMIQLPAAITDLLEIGDGRDLGAGVFGLLLDKTLEYDFGVFDGEQKYTVDPTIGFLPASNLRSRGNIDFEFVGRMVYHPYGYLPALDESDLAYSEKPKMSVGASASFNKRHDVRAPDPFPFYMDDRLLKAGIEFDFRWRGFSLEAEGFLRKAWLLPMPWLPADPDNEQRRKFNALHVEALGKSAYLQSGYFVMPQQLELTGRLDYVDVEPATPGYILRPAVGLNLFLHGYNVLAQFMYRASIGVGFDNYMDFRRSLRPTERTDNYIGDPAGDRRSSRITHDFMFMLQTSI